MIARIARLTRAEFLKLSANPFLLVSLAVVGAAVLLAAVLQPALRQQEETAWRTLNAALLFVYGFKVGLKIATYVLIVFSSMLFAGEFDRGTIKNLLTRPISRGDLFAAKCLVVAGLAAFLFAATLWMSLAYAFARGDAGPVWDRDQYYLVRSGAEMGEHAVRAVGMSLPSFLAAGFLGLLVSNWTESSGYSVAIALILFLVGDFVTDYLPPAGQQKVFLHYAPYALEKLQSLAEGTNTRWDPDVVDRRLHLWVPAAYAAAFIPLAFGIFRARNITS